jgi:hypothetical protein
MKLKHYDVDLFEVPEHTYPSVRIQRTGGPHVGRIDPLELQFIITQLMMDNEKMRELLQAVVDRAAPNAAIEAVDEYINSLPK